MPKLLATTLQSSIRQSRGFRRILARSFAAFDTLKGYHKRYHPEQRQTDMAARLGDCRIRNGGIFGVTKLYGAGPAHYRSRLVGTVPHG